MEVVITSSAREAGGLAADAIEALVRSKPAAVLGTATGSSPLPIYTELVRRHRDGIGPSYDGGLTFNLDECGGLPPGHEQTYLATIHRELTDDLGLARERVHGPDPAEEGI